MSEAQAVQKRSITIPKVSFRAAVDGKPAVVSGHASVFNVLSEPLAELGGCREMIAPGTFSRAISEPDDIRLLINHDPNLVLARNTAGTLTVSEDEIGLYFEATLPNTSYANDLAESMRRGDVTGCSFAFMIENAEMRTIGGEPVQVITGAEVSDCSIVTYPAYPAATASIRANELVFKTTTIDTEVPPPAVADLPTVNPNVARRKRELDVLALD